MMELAMAHASRIAERRRRAQVERLVERMRAALPLGVRADAEAGGIAIIGRGLKRRLALDRELRPLSGRMR